MILELNITLLRLKKSVSRKLLVSHSLSLYELHHTIQIAFGWQNRHLYSFKAGRETFGHPILLGELEPIDDSTVTLENFYKFDGDRIIYEYDFGDRWMHSVVFEGIVYNAPEIKHPVCIEGKSACPPEDCGSYIGYHNLLEIMKKPKHPQYNKLVEWLGKPFDPEAFNLKSVNEELKNLNNYIAKFNKVNFV